MTILKFIRLLFTSVPRRRPADCARKIHAGSMLLVDVREPHEWDAGVAEKAVLLPLSDLRRARELWQPFLATTAGRGLVLYCKVGGRANVAARLLAAEGFNAANGGGLHEWAKAGWNIVPPGKPHP